MTVLETEQAKEIARLKDALEDMVNQFASYAIFQGILQRNTAGHSSLENAFDALGLDDPHPCPEHECEWEGCHEMAVGGRPTEWGYMRLCSKHLSELR